MKKMKSSNGVINALVIVVFVLVAFGLAFCSPTQPAHAAQTQIVGYGWLTIPGYWTPIRQELSGEPLPDRQVFHVKVTIPGNPSCTFRLVPAGYASLENDAFIDQRPAVSQTAYFSQVVLLFRLVYDINGSSDPDIYVSVPKELVVMTDGTIVGRTSASKLIDVVNMKDHTIICNSGG